MLRRPDHTLIFDRLDFRPLGGRLCVTSLQLATEIGFERPRQLDRWIGHHLENMAGVDAPQAIDATIRIGRRRVRKSRSYWLTQAHVYYVIMECRTPQTKDALVDLIWDMKRIQDEMGVSVFETFTW
ncbi:MAG: hypothetical protein J0J10_05620 [Bosea sp.]|uniref:hypothetical protein n=1 Tax=Bosea sp. (in: a-proteobacteria) TaxID=1871050 RepID=UPI001AD3D4CD|nr:hypothetical protein [Bosea sp. (in: a-proteobacteria)]MBN9468232.1 hypothetical protein [Bosea sp. (in: a-proteobacteria)]